LSRISPALKIDCIGPSAFAYLPRQIICRLEDFMIPRSGLRYRGRSLGNLSTCACHSRRGFLAGVGAIGAATLLSRAAARAEVASPAVRTVDVHHHIFPPRYLSDNFEHISKSIGSFGSKVQGWSPQRAIEQMDQAGVATAINSMTSPGVWFEDGDAARARARTCNEFGAQMARDFPGRFGMFAAIPLPDTDGSLNEMAYALDVLKLDGVGLLTSYAGKLLGDPAFAPVFEEINRRKAIVFVHPTMSCCGNPMPGVSPPTIEFPMDSTRTITSLLFSGGFARYADIRFIFSHGGGMLLPIVQRLYSAAAQMKPEERAIKMPKGPEYELTRQYYELASIGFNPAGVAGLRKLLPNSQLLYGSDEPFLSTVQMASALQKLDFSTDELAAVQRGNAARLFARLQT
jgi:predicted TIM-barrel fold metal-dependent hydrolase